MSRFGDVAVFVAGFLAGLAAASSRTTRPAGGARPPAPPPPTLAGAAPPQDFDGGVAAGAQPPTAEQITALYFNACRTATRAHEAILTAWSNDPRSDALRRANSDMITYLSQLAQWSIDSILRAPDVAAAVQKVQGAIGRLQAATREMFDVADAERAAAGALSALSDLVSVFT